MDTAPTDVGPFGFTFHQVAIFTTMPEEAVEQFARMGYADWTWDRAVLRGCRIINGEWQPVVTSAEMAFNYQIMPMELEFLNYDGVSEHRHRERAQLSSIPFISHMSVHVDSVIDTISRLRVDHGVLPYHIFVTSQHTNPAVAGIKRFVECIFDTRSALGFDIKSIERIAWDADVTAEDIIRAAGIA